MRCYICDRTLSDSEIQYDQDFQSWDPCSTCLDVIDSVFSDPLTEDEVTAELREEWPEEFPEPPEEKT